jgi:hypothetical protein
MSAEQTEPITPPEARPAEVPSEGKRGIYDLLQSLKGGKLDPITALLVMSEMRRIDRDEERWELEKQRLSQPQPNPSKEVDFEKLIDKINETWEKRFAEYQSNTEKLLLKGKVEEAESKAERLEKELKEMKEKMEHEKLLEEKVTKAIEPYKEQISQLQQILAERTKGMSENEKRGFFQSLGEQIEQSLSQEVTGTIAKTVSEAIVNAFTPKEEKETVPVTAEGKLDTYKMVDKWVREGLKTVQTLAQRWPQQKPTPREVQKIPIPPPSAITTPSPAEATTTTVPPTITIPPPAETTITTPTPATPTVTVSPPEVAVSTPSETPKEQPPQEPKQPEPEAKPEIPEQPKQEAKPEAEEKQPVRAKPRKRSETTQESAPKQES